MHDVPDGGELFVLEDQEHLDQGRDSGGGFEMAGGGLYISGAA